MLDRDLLIGDPVDRKNAFADPKNPTSPMKVEPEELAANFKTSFFIFCIQLGLAIFSTEAIFEPDDDTSTNKIKIGALKEGQEMIIISVRFICALALHLQIEGEVLQAMNFLKISIYKTSNQHKRMAMFSIGMMQLSAAIATEALNIVQISMTIKIKEIIANFV
jgi:hypothetical protein